ncbi:hypothetical protein KSD_34640 [Ktedonobacter sp. SOSP1-85]|nr:hypothetical protein KSD_34640 [Ktedonobacter sp. SOSP1-85]
MQTHTFATDILVSPIKGKAGSAEGLTPLCVLSPIPIKGKAGSAEGRQPLCVLFPSRRRRYESLSNEIEQSISTMSYEYDGIGGDTYLLACKIGWEVVFAHEYLSYQVCGAVYTRHRRART